MINNKYKVSKVYLLEFPKHWEIRFIRSREVLTRSAYGGSYSSIVKKESKLFRLDKTRDITEKIFDVFENNATNKYYSYWLEYTFQDHSISMDWKWFNREDA